VRATLKLELLLVCSFIYYRDMDGVRLVGLVGLVGWFGLVGLVWFFISDLEGINTNTPPTACG